MDNQTITAGIGDLYRQAFMTAEDYFRATIRAIDEEFGEGYAKKHPELIGKYMEVIALDFHSSSIALGLQKISDALDGLKDYL